MKSDSKYLSDFLLELDSVPRLLLRLNECSAALANLDLDQRIQFAIAILYGLSCRKDGVVIIVSKDGYDQLEYHSFKRFGRQNFARLDDLAAGLDQPQNSQWRPGHG